MTITEQKAAQRKAGIAARRALAPETRAAANAALCARLAALPCFRQARTILLYAAFGGEADLATLAETARGLGKTLAYPVCGENFSLTVGKKKYAAVEADLRALNARAEVLRRRLEALVQADAEGFLPLAAAYGLPKETPEQQAHKAAVLEQALDGACAVPLEIMEACCEGIALAQEYAAKGSALAVSDAGCAALFCKAALQASGLNVSINTKLMADRAHAEALNAKADALLAQYVPLADTLYEKMATQLRGEV